MSNFLGWFFHVLGGNRIEKLHKMAFIIFFLFCLKILKNLKKLELSLQNFRYGVLHLLYSGLSNDQLLVDSK